MFLFPRCKILTIVLTQIWTPRTFTVGLSLWSENRLWNFGKCPIYVDVQACGEAGIRRVICCCVCGWTLRLLGSPRACTGAGVPVCLHFLQTVGFVLNVGQQNPSYVKGRRAGGRADAGRELLVVVQLWPWRRLWRTSVCQSTAGGEQGETQRGKRLRAPMMKTVLSLHRKWAHAVKTIRILQGLVSAILIAV